jgi:hypothetical protein
MKHPFVVDTCGKYVLDETLANFIKHNSTQQQRGKERTKGEEGSLSQKHKNPKRVAKGQRNKLRTSLQLEIVLFGS